MLRPLIALLVLASLLAARPAAACTVPVFRYALERWATEPHLVRAPAAERAALRAAVADLAGMPFIVLDEDPAAAGGVQIDFPHDGGAWWRGPLPAGGLPGLASSPALQRASRMLASGASIVWVVVDGPDPAANEAFSAALAKRLEMLAGIVSLPEQPAPDDESAAPWKMRLDHIPLKLDFPRLRIAGDDPAEAALRAQFAAIRGEPAKQAGPYAVPIYGQLRGLSVIDGPLADVAVVDDVVHFLTGACSCQIKELNPGFDLLAAVSWDDLLSPPADAPAPVAAAPAAPAVGSSPSHPAGDHAAGNHAAPEVAISAPAERHRVAGPGTAAAIVLMALGLVLAIAMVLGLKRLMQGP